MAAALLDPEVLVISADATPGWEASARELCDGLERAGVRTRVARTGPIREERPLIRSDLVRARAARRVTSRALAQSEPAAIVYCSILSTLLWPRPGAIWFDALTAESRPGRQGLWQHIVERRRLADSPLLLTMAPDSLDPLPRERRPESIVLPVGVDRSGPEAPERDIDVLTYAGDPHKRRLDLVLAAWQRARREGETLVVAGVSSDAEVPGVRFAGHLASDEYRALVRRARVFVAAPQREDYGLSPLEALVDGCQLVTTPSPGPYAALALARELDPRLVCDDLVPALRVALDQPRPGYRERAAALLAPFSRAAVDATLAERVLPRLLPGWA